MPWADISKDASIEVTFTEGQFSAAIACFFGIKCLALAGVWNFTSKACGYDFLPELETWAWAGRRVVLCFDSDVMSKAGVAQAPAAFAAQLKERGATVFVRYLSSEADGGKNGIDDYLLRHGREAYDAIKLVESTATVETLAANSDAIAEMYDDMNERFLWVEKIRAVFDTKTSDPIKPPEFLSCFTEYNVTVENKDKKGGTHKVYGAKLLLDKKERKVWNLVCEPGEPREFIQDGKPVMNVYSGPVPTPRRGDVSIWHRMMKHVFDENVKARTIYEQIVGWQRRHFGVKIPIGLLFWGTQGAGKSLLGLAVGALYGGPSGSFMEIVQDDLDDRYGDAFVGKCFAVIDELFTGDSHKVAAKYKNLISKTVRRVESKYGAVYYVRDPLNYHFTSNEFDAAYITDDDRRWFVYQVRRKMEDTDPTLAADLVKWLGIVPPVKDRKERPMTPQEMKAVSDAGQTGRDALDYYLFNEVDIEDFNPFHAAKILDTEDKRRMINAGKSDKAHFAASLIGETLRLGRGGLSLTDLWTGASIEERYLDEYQSERGGSGLRKSLIAACYRAGMDTEAQLNEDDDNYIGSVGEAPTKKRIRATVLAVANAGEWRKLGRDAWLAALLATGRVNQDKF